MKMCSLQAGIIGKKIRQLKVELVKQGINSPPNLKMIDYHAVTKKLYIHTRKGVCLNLNKEHLLPLLRSHHHNSVIFGHGFETAYTHAPEAAMSSSCFLPWYWLYEAFNTTHERPGKLLSCRLPSHGGT